MRHDNANSCPLRIQKLTMIHDYCQDDLGESFNLRKTQKPRNFVSLVLGEAEGGCYAFLNSIKYEEVSVNSFEMKQKSSYLSSLLKKPFETDFPASVFTSHISIVSDLFCFIHFFIFMNKSDDKSFLGFFFQSFSTSENLRGVLQHFWLKRQSCVRPTGELNLKCQVSG